MTKREKKLVALLALLYKWYDDRMKNEYYDPDGGDAIWEQVREILDGM